MRLAGLAHALLGNPRLILLDDPYRDLDEDASDMLELLLETEIEKRRWIASLSTNSARSRRLLLSAEQVLSAELGRLVGPLPPSRFESQAHWARFRKVTDELKAELARAGGRIIATPHCRVLLLQGLGGKHVARAALATDCDLLELRPMGTPSSR
jgi:ABC-type taurine transport system ATPase subunit